MSSDKNKRVLKIIFFILTAAVTLFIFGQSILPGEASVKLSKEVSAAVSVPESIKLSAPHNTVRVVNIRKVAHYIEFFALGVSLSLICAVGGMKLQSLVNAAFYGLAVCVTDESIQLLTNRASLVLDVLRDACGCAVGILTVFIIYTVLRPVVLAIRQKRK